MSHDEPETKPAPAKPGRGGIRGTAREKPRTEAPGPDRRAAARAIYEGRPGATCETAAAEVGVPYSTVKRWKAEDGWKPIPKALPELSARAGALADSWKLKMSELGKPLDDEVAGAEAAREVAVDLAVDVRAQVLDRHRKEWAAPRNIAYQAIKEATGPGADVGKAFERAKLAKITSETLTLIQAGECKAFGITADARGGDGATVVVVERDRALPAQSQPAGEPAGPPLDAAVQGSPETSTDDEDF